MIPKAVADSKAQEAKDYEAEKPKITRAKAMAEANTHKAKDTEAEEL